MAPLLGDWDGSTLSTTPNDPSKNVLYVDAYDSFSYNVVSMLEETLGVKVTVMTIDSEWPDGNMHEFLRHYEAIVLGPGPGNPNLPKDVGIMRDIWNLQDAELLPIFGICLGFQSLCLHHGVPIERLPYPLHGQVHRISTSSSDIFRGLSDIEVTLYHSLYANLDKLSHAQVPSVDDLEFLAWLSLENSSARRKRIPMAVRHRQKPFWGVQFHPESCKSEKEACKQLLQNWWAMALAFNKIIGREAYGALPETIITPQDETSTFPDIAYDMLRWSSSTSPVAAHRSFQRGDWTAETISEAFNKPGSPTVVFQSDSRYSIVSIPSPNSWRLEYSVERQKLTLYQLSGDCQILEKSLAVIQLWDALRYLMDMKKVSSGSMDSPFWGGFLGYFSYELGLACLPHSKESAQKSTSNEPPVENSSAGPHVEDLPDVSLLWCERSIVVDNETGNVVVQSTRVSDDLTGNWLEEASQLLKGQSQNVENTEKSDLEFLDSILRHGVISFPEEMDYKERIAACNAELEAGESYELCLTAETSISLPVAATEADRAVFPWKLYRRLKKYNPARYSGFATLGSVKIVSSSPECFLDWDREFTLEMKPMKGTVRKTPDMTLAQAKEILSSTKEMAENLMIADLIRHDLYGICGPGGVHVEKLLEVEDYGRVYSMITHVKGKIRPDQPGYSVRHIPQFKSSNMAVHGLTTLQRCLPPGSMTGAPKERSCMHLKTIEGRKRGIYSGVMGYLDLGGGGSFAVMIRMAFTCSTDQDQEQIWRIGAGGAVTTLSTPEGEWQEMLTKLRTVGNIFAPFEGQ
ncbi:uncharacterized protein N7484_001659 [Penicillium longicatenatum]|uniref:uncharacterized protein n=1 Tax=Penicillium longicatenatum TaxID=1561947 RepID=UPI0025496075|nr:uncharacterized protein N7484_001659 [Penicillium longicatenatum]KAJ5658010.1 hypothetical protein N7484_001659 [Penicillium longicatenatum]